MKQTFTRTRKVWLEIYEEFKYTASEEVIENPQEIIYNNAVAFEVIGADDERVKEIESFACDLIDDLHEYLVIYLEDGATATFRNSYCDLF